MRATRNDNPPPDRWRHVQERNLDPIRGDVRELGHPTFLPEHQPCPTTPATSGLVGSADELRPATAAMVCFVAVTARGSRSFPARQPTSVRPGRPRLHAARSGLPVRPRERLPADCWQRNRSPRQRRWSRAAARTVRPDAQRPCLIASSMHTRRPSPRTAHGARMSIDPLDCWPPHPQQARLFQADPGLVSSRQQHLEPSAADGCTRWRPSRTTATFERLSIMTVLFGPGSTTRGNGTRLSSTPVVAAT